jgi:transposase-like protein
LNIGGNSLSWRAVDHEFEVLKPFVTETRKRAAALMFIKKVMSRTSKAWIGKKRAPMVETGSSGSPLNCRVPP